MASPKRLNIAVSALVVALFLLGQGCSDASRVCAADKRSDLFGREGSFVDEEETPSVVHPQRFPDCGWAPPGSRNYTAIARQFAPLVRIFWRTQFVCYGVLLSEKHILTHGSCKDKEPDNHWIDLPEPYQQGGYVMFNYKGPRIGLKPKRPTVIEKKCGNGDFSVFKISPSFEYFHEIRHSACLPTAELAEGKHADVLLFEEDKDDEDEKRSPLPVERTPCLYKPEDDDYDDDHDDKPPKRDICLRPRNDQRVCPSHTGAPVIAFQDGRPTVVGLVSYRDKSFCFQGNELEENKSVFVDIFKQRAHIEQLIEECS